MNHGPFTRPSAATARRIRQAMIDAPEPEPLDANMQLVLDNFRPHGPIAPQWPLLAPVAGEVLRRSQLRGAESFRKHLTHVGYFLAWARAQGLPLEIGTLIRQYTDEYTRIGMPHATPKSRADRRAHLRRLADRINPQQAPDRGVPVAHPSVKPPYSPTEMTHIRRVARTQPTAARRRALSLCVGLGAGAGLDSADLRHLRRSDITDHGTAGISVAVRQPNPRTVVVLRDYESIVRDGLAGMQPDQLLLGRKEDRRNVAARVIGEAVLLGDCPKIEQSRLRATWLAHLMASSVPLAVILHAAGLRTARTLAELLPHLPSPHPDAITYLRDAGRAA